VALEILEDGGHGVGRRLSDGRVRRAAIGLNLQVVCGLGKTLQIEAEVVVVVERAGSGREILKFSCGNLVYECAKGLLETGSHVV